ncbi:hypothetical protein T484DRAFT_1611652, partial [Baffinella frigidus]
RNPEPETLNPKPETRNPEPVTLNPQPWTLDPKPFTLHVLINTPPPQWCAMGPGTPTPAQPTRRSALAARERYTPHCPAILGFHGYLRLPRLAEACPRKPKIHAILSLGSLRFMLC